MFSSIRSAIREYVHPHSPTLVSPANTNQRQKNNKAAKLGKTAKLIPQGIPDEMTILFDDWKAFKN